MLCLMHANNCALRILMASSHIIHPIPFLRRYFCEDMISAAGGAAVAAEDADWSGKQLTAMYHIQFLSLATTINLSNNALRRLDGFGLLLNVVELNLDNNNLEGTEEDLLFFWMGSTRRGHLIGRRHWWWYSAAHPIRAGRITPLVSSRCRTLLWILR